MAELSKTKTADGFFQPYLHVKEFPLSSRVTEHTQTQFQMYVYTNALIFPSTPGLLWH